jgi:flavin reductase (DIM6/NTAB) family NADH-FMN oxidoreductase RutF
MDDKHQVGLYRPAAHHNYCLPQLALRVHYLHYLWLQRRRKSNDPFALSGAELHRLLIFYTYPRPVFLISVTSPLRSNIFPMDLIGRAGDSHYLLALRSTTPSVGLIQEVGRIAMSRIPLDLAPVAYELGKHHRLTNIDWNTLPFTVAPSSTFGIPVPRDALGVTELAIESSHVVGSHTVFVARIVSVDHRRDGLQMAHVQGFYQHYLQRIAGMPLPTPGSGSSRNSKSTASSQSTSPP